MASPRPLIALLGYAGLLPFIVPAFLVVGHSQYAMVASSFAETYAFGIVSFLCGSWWGLALRDHSSKAFLLSNLFFLLAFFVFMALRPWWPLTAAAVLISLLLIEQKSSVFSSFPRHYRVLRMQLSIVASVCLLLIHVFFTTR